MHNRPRQIAIIGAGISGSYLANRLNSFNHVCVFDKARGPGGRLSSRKLLSQSYTPLGCLSDIDLSYLPPNTKKPKDIYQWSAQLPQKALIPCNHALAFPPQTVCQRFLQSIDTTYQCPISRIEKNTNRWTLYTSDRLLVEVDWVVTALPAPQALTLLPENCSYLSDLQQVLFQPTISVVLGFSQAIPHHYWTNLSTQTTFFSNIYHYPSHKQDHNFYYTFHMTTAWSEKHFSATDSVILDNIKHLNQDLGHCESPFYHHIHRWRYAYCSNPSRASLLVDTHQNIASVGDWCIGSKANDALESAHLMTHFFQSI